VSTTNSKRIAGLVGPTIVAMVASEFPLVQLTKPGQLRSFVSSVFDGQAGGPT
jgi:hypothetical protein